MKMSPRRGANSASNRQPRNSPASPGSSLADSAYGILKRKIIRCEMPPGLHVTESQLVNELGIGKTPVREALARLVQEGLVDNYPRYGYVVAPITLGDVRELFGLRLIVEPVAVQMAAGRVDEAELRRLDESCGTAAFDEGDSESLDEHLHANRELHVAIARASGNRRLAELVEQLMDESERMLHLSLVFRNRRDEILHEHHELVDTLVAGDGEGAGRIAVEQILAAQQNVTDALLSSPSVLSAQVAPPAALLPSAAARGG